MNVVAGPGATCGQRLVEHPDVAKIAFTGLDRGRARRSPRPRRHDQARDARARRQVGQRRLRRRRPRGARPRRRRARCSTTPARTAARARGSSSSARRVDEFLDAPRGRRSTALRVGDPLDEATEMGPLICAGQREAVASFVPDDAPVAIRGSAPDGPGLLVRADRAVPGRADRPRRDGGDLRAGRGRDPVRRRGRGDPPRQRHDLRPVGLDLDARRREGAARRARDRERQPLDQLELARCASRRRSAASSSRATAASWGRTRSTHYTEVKTIFYATEGS